MRKLILFLFLLGIINPISAQEEDEWQPETFITGYVNSIAEYTDASAFKDADKTLGIGLSEASFLISYKPLEKLELKGTFVYNHNVLDFQEILVEAYGTYTIKNEFKISAGKFLSPLSPINQYFYAPLNPSGVLPMIVSHHFLTPQSISGFQISGEFGNDLKFGYNLTYGNYSTIGHRRMGILRIIGTEDLAHWSQTPFSEVVKQTYQLGGSGRLYAKYNLFSLGFNYFEGTKATQAYALIDPATGQITSSSFAPSHKSSYGVDFHVNIDEKLKINGEYWKGKNETTELDEQVKFEYTGYYGEVIYTHGIFSPFLRYEYVDDYKAAGYVTFPDVNIFNGSVATTSIGGGLAIRPIYEILIKLDYRSINLINDDDAKNILQFKDETYSHLMLSVVYSF